MHTYLRLARAASTSSMVKNTKTSPTTVRVMGSVERGRKAIVKSNARRDTTVATDATALYVLLLRQRRMLSMCGAAVAAAAAAAAAVVLPPLDIVASSA